MLLRHLTGGQLPADTTQQTMPKSPSSRRSARAQAQRPQLVPREQPRTAAAQAEDDGVAPVLSDPRGWVTPVEGDGGIEPEQEQAYAEVERAREHRVVPLPPRSAPAAPKASAAPAQLLEYRPPTYGDFDRLWDWVRGDEAGAVRFLGRMPEHSKALHDYLLSIMGQEAEGAAKLRSVYATQTQGEAQHIGFVSLMPIVRAAQPPTGVAHCYLSPPLQGYLPQLLPVLLDLAGNEEPELTLTVVTDDYAFARLLQPHGFSLTIALTRPPKQSQR